jgi:hypothetical protein
MRIIDLFEDETSELMGDLNSLLLVMKSNNELEVPTLKLVKTINNLGHNVTFNSLISALSSNPMVVSADKDNVKLSDGNDTPDEETGDINQDEIDQMTVDKMADIGNDI